MLAISFLLTTFGIKFHFITLTTIHMKKLLLSVAAIAMSFCAFAEGETSAPKVYFEDDFSITTPYHDIPCAKTGRTAYDFVGTNQGGDTLDSAAPQISQVSIDGVTLEQAFNNKGYSFIRYNKTAKTTAECIYFMTNCLRFGKTDYRGGITLPAIPELGDGTSNLTFTLEWYSQRNTKGAFDKTELVVIVSTPGSDDVTFPIAKLPFTDFDPAKWTSETIELTGLTLTKDSRITVINKVVPEAGAKRWHLNSVKLAAASSEAGVGNVAVDQTNAPVTYYNLQGVRVDNPTRGLYILQQGTKVTKVAL